MALLPRNRNQKGDSRASQLAARQAAQNEAFLREVDDALREDEMFGALKRWGTLVGAVVVIALAGLGGWLWWQSHSAHQADLHAEAFTIALDHLDAGDPDGAMAQLGPIATGSDGSAAAARLMQAGIAAKQGRPQQAEGLYAAVAADSGVPQPFRDLATIRTTALRFDQLPPEQVIATLRPLAAPGGPWFGSAGELLGMAYLKQGRKDLAAPLFGSIARDTTVPDSLRARARQVAGLLGYDAVDDIARAPAAGAPSPQTAPQPGPAAQ